MANPLNITAHCLQGRKLPDNWRQLAPGAAAAAEAVYLDKLQNAWKQAGNNAQQHLPPMVAARLTVDAAEPAHSGHQSRLDGQLVLERTDANGFEEWRDTVTGAIIRRRLSWKDIVGEK